MVPEAADSLICVWIGESLSVEVKDGELVLGKDIGLGLCLNATPDLSNTRVKVVLRLRVYRRRTLLDGVERSLNCEMTVRTHDG